MTALADLDFNQPLPASTDLDLALEWNQAPIRTRLTWQGVAGWGATLRRPVSHDLPWVRPDGKALHGQIPWGQARAQPEHTRLHWAFPHETHAQQRQPWGEAAPLETQIISPWRTPPRLNDQQRLPWGTSAPVGADLAAIYRHPAKKDFHRSAPWGQPRALTIQRTIPWGHLTWRAKRYKIPWNQGHRPSHVWPPPYVPPYEPPVDPVICDYQPGHVADFDFDEAAPGDTRFEFWCRAPIRPLVTRTLIMLPTASVVKLPSREALEVASVSLSLDIDSWAWDMRATVPATALALIQPDGNGPAEIEITLSGHVWTMLVEGFAESREFGSAAYSVHGRGTVAYLAAPYAPARTTTQNNIRTARQLAEEELVNTGWTIDWSNETPDWLVPGGVWSYENLTPMDAIGKIAASVGSVILPSMADKVLTIRPRYRFNVWNLGAAANNATLDPSILTGLSLQWSPQPKYNGVYVSGIAQGVAVFTKRAVPAGELQAPMATDALITEPAAGLERGRQILNAAGNKARVTLNLPLTANGTLPGLMQPGHVIEVLESAPWKGIVTAVSISAEMSDAGPSQRQTLEIERHYE